MRNYYYTQTCSYTNTATISNLLYKFYKSLRLLLFSYEIPMTLIEKLFCTAACKKLNQKTRSRLILKFFIMVGLAIVMACGLTSNILFLILSITNKNLSIGATIPLFVVYIYLFLLVCNHYIYTAMRDPGSIDPGFNSIQRYCAACQIVKPYRAHHCSQCQRCFLKMDHHCPWVQNCVGSNNYGSFFALMTSASFFYPYSIIVYCLGIYYQRKQYLYKLILDSINLVFAAVLSFVTIQLFQFHCVLIGTNQTTIEYYENQNLKKLDKNFKSFYDLGIKTNIKEVYPCSMVVILVPFMLIKSNIPKNGYYSVDEKTNVDYFVKPEDQIAVTAQANSEQERERETKEVSQLPIQQFSESEPSKDRSEENDNILSTNKIIVAQEEVIALQDKETVEVNPLPPPAPARKPKVKKVIRQGEQIEQGDGVLSPVNQNKVVEDI